MHASVTVAHSGSLIVVIDCADSAGVKQIVKKKEAGK